MMEIKEITPRLILITGPNGSGKTLYAEKMRREMASDSVRYIAFSDSYGSLTDRAYYLQLRWNQHDIDAEIPTAGQAIERAYGQTGTDTHERRQYCQRLITMMGLDDSLDKYVIQLSSGELRKLQLVKTLLSKPKTLIIDNPFIGLDAPTRQQLREMLWHLAQDDEITIYLLVSRKEDASSFPPHTPAAVVELRHVTVSYGSRTILNDINWTIRQGEHWALSGPNGSGKSTLLSLICADNPQAYACDISLFGRRRGTGETIWDIKRRIGYISPEMHRSYRHNIPVLQIVASGLKDTMGLYTRTNDEEKGQCRKAMRLFGLLPSHPSAEDMEKRLFLTLSSGEQRLALLARAFVKDPDLLILDEPLHGLDDRNSEMVKGIINDYCSRPDKTLIMVSHYEEELPACIDHRMVLSNTRP